LRELVEGAVRDRPAEAMLLSWGLDTSVLAPLAARGGTHAAVTVLVAPAALDGPYATRIARRLGWSHRIAQLSLDQLLGEVDLVVRVLRSFDPMELRNSIVIARALREAAALGATRVMTGDAADELFGGYTFMWAKPPGEFEEYSRRMAETMRFSSIPLGRELGVTVLAPYTDPEVVRFATGLAKELKVGPHGGTTFGKLVVREAFPEAEACWRVNDPIEVGSGSRALSRYLAERLPPDRFEAERRRILAEDRVTIRDPEHLAYYRRFRAVFPDGLAGPRFGPSGCDGCGYDLEPPGTLLCRTCGAYPARAGARRPTPGA
jgi:asparagine synthetase B (glutamine-hydrolysing)